MSTAAIIMLAVKASLALVVFAVSLDARPSDATYLLRHPWLLLRSILAMNVIMPFVALWFTIVFSLNPPVKLALIALAISPVPPFLPGKALKSGGDGAYVVGLLAAMTVLSISIIPLSLMFFGSLFDLTLTIRPATIANIVAVGILLPLVVGIAVRWLRPALADKLVKPVHALSTVVLAAGLLPILIKAWPGMRAVIDDGTLFAIVGIAVIGVAVGHTFGGPVPENRPVLALATACRHPAIALTVATTMFPGLQLVGAVVLASLLIGSIVTLPYVRMSQRALSRLKPPTRRASDLATHPRHSH